MTDKIGDRGSPTGVAAPSRAHASLCTTRARDRCASAAARRARFTAARTARLLTGRRRGREMEALWSRRRSRKSIGESRRRGLTGGFRMRQRGTDSPRGSASMCRHSRCRRHRHRHPRPRPRPRPRPPLLRRHPSHRRRFCRPRHRLSCPRVRHSDRHRLFRCLCPRLRLHGPRLHLCHSRHRVRLHHHHPCRRRRRHHHCFHRRCSLMRVSPPCRLALEPTRSPWRWPCHSPPYSRRQQLRSSCAAGTALGGAKAAVSLRETTSARRKGAASFATMSAEGEGPPSWTLVTSKL